MPQEFEGAYEICLDKGTFDAISLSDAVQSEVRDCYFRNVSLMLKSGGIFILTSCNWTLQELNLFSETYFKCKKHIPTPQFSFGGKSGQLVSIAVLKKK